ncbi:site-2 protease family protein [Chengkuizengella axinellae]|uniref:Site-2 protease family protein n=1 Tax=Chengkuizengella axinellae TaxID=3064388 RepID=A0ABT9J0S2_9BACL|nr:site-2 protease family protein [Chengkuizengella sp. 2205SS18-9]MDP5275197.1 site-2 protease family protein [Chengkuizengella sp. 2205SS18-9]
MWFLGAIGVFLLGAGKNILVVLKSVKFAGPLLSMLISVGAYAVIFPLEFAVGLVLMLLIHELGHVIAAKQKGLPVSAPFFIPFLGALISMKRNPRDAVTEAYIAIGGPVLGTAGAVAAFLIGLNLGGEWGQLLLVIAYVGFLLNLVNLLPIHPLDGGRISTAVTRWLWLVGLIGGLIVIIYFLRSPLFFIIWVLFAWELFQKYVKRKGKGKKLEIGAKLEIPVETLLQQGFIIPSGSEQFNNILSIIKKELTFSTYSILDGQQKLKLIWEELDLKQTIDLPMQGIIHKVDVSQIETVQKESGRFIKIHCVIDLEQFEPDNYYNVPNATRWRYGLAYGALAVFLGYMLYMTSVVGQQTLSNL